MSKRPRTEDADLHDFFKKKYKPIEDCINRIKDEETKDALSLLLDSLKDIAMDVFNSHIEVTTNALIDVNYEIAKTNQNIRNMVACSSAQCISIFSGLEEGRIITCTCPSCSRYHTGLVCDTCADDIDIDCVKRVFK